MYLKRIISENVGPIEKVDIKPSFNDDGSPKPLILVGENGSGKSTLLSNIVDSFYNFADEAFSNVMVSNGSFSKKYYKVIMPLEIHSGKQYMYSYLSYDNPDVSYFFKSGEFDKADFQKNNGNDCPIVFNWEKKGNVKVSNMSSEVAEKTFGEEVVCFFGPNRYEKPVWMAKEYYEGERENPHIYLKAKWDGVLNNPISVKNTTTDNLAWLLDVVVDSRADVIGDESHLQLAHLNAATLVYRRKTRENIENVVSQILGKNVYFSLNLRNQGLGRFCIKENNTEKIIVPSLDSLSTGELALLNLFLTIARYGDVNNVKNSVSLSEILGIVVVDEVELHLHSNLQKDILPSLIKLFPKIQFILTSHSPLFLLGMRDTFGEDGFDVVEMPSGNKIDVERFREFQKAYDYYQHTQKHQEEIDGVVNQIRKDTSEKPLIITEGHTDWKHMKAAYENLKDREEYKDIFENLDFKFLEYEAANSPVQADIKIEMGNTALTSMCEAMAKLPHSRKMIFIADCDDKDTNKKMTETGKVFKDWKNNVYSFILPVPENRSDNPAICIEHLYSDDEIKTEYDVQGVKRRLFIGNEFDEHGLSNDSRYLCIYKNFCGPKKNNIIESRSEKGVVLINGDRSKNYAWTKTDFANCVLNKVSPFDKFDFSNFVEIFKIIKEICNKDMV